MPRNVIFLDRDGTLNVDHGYVYRIADFVWLPKAIEAVKLLRTSGAAIAVVTNQSGIGRGKYTVEDVERLHTHMLGELRAAGTTVDAVSYCPHAPEEACACRKPSAGMARDVARQLGEEIDYAKSWMVGDKPSDIGFGRGLGMQTALLRSRYWEEQTLDQHPDHVCDTLYDVAQLISGQASA